MPHCSSSPRCNPPSAPCSYPWARQLMCTCTWAVAGRQGCCVCSRGRGNGREGGTLASWAGPGAPQRLDCGGPLDSCRHYDLDCTPQSRQAEKPAHKDGRRGFVGPQCACRGGTFPGRAGPAGHGGTRSKMVGPQPSPPGARPWQLPAGDDPGCVSKFYSGCSVSCLLVNTLLAFAGSSPATQLLCFQCAGTAVLRALPCTSVRSHGSCCQH